jgi:hypothetical protein
MNATQNTIGSQNDLIDDKKVGLLELLKQRDGPEIQQELTRISTPNE